MAGRAGWMGFDETGESILIADEKSRSLAMSLFAEFR